jgi:hypothetical protein
MEVNVYKYYVPNFINVALGVQVLLRLMSQQCVRM